MYSTTVSCTCTGISVAELQLRVIAPAPARVPDPAFRVFIVLGKSQNKPQVPELTGHTRNKYAQYRKDNGVLTQDTQYSTVLYNSVQYSKDNGVLAQDTQYCTVQ